MAIKNVEQYYSCKRKRDYVKGLAIFLFVFMILAQIFLVVFLHSNLQQMKALDLYISKTRLQMLVDTSRSTIKLLESYSDEAHTKAGLIRTRLNQEEEKLVSDVLDRWVMFLRDDDTLDKMNAEQVNEVKYFISRFLAIESRWIWWDWLEDGKQVRRPKFEPRYFIKEEIVYTPKYVRVLEKGADRIFENATAEAGQGDRKNEN